jgi:hypothetical protein
VFYIDEDTWTDLVRAAGGWPEEPVEVEEARATIAELASRRRGTGQGPRITPEVRQAVEDYAMMQAKEYFNRRGWSWTDVSAN